jgi:hypothetical protein
MSSLTAEPPSITVKVYSALTDDVLCEVTAADVASGYGCKDLPPGVPLKIAIIDSTTGFATKTITLH